jgi:hypothetical protein
MKKLTLATLALAAASVAASSAMAAVTVNFTVNPNVGTVNGVPQAKFVFYVLNNGGTTASTGSTQTGILAGQLSLSSNVQPRYGTRTVDENGDPLPAPEVTPFASEANILGSSTTSRFETSLWSLAGNPSLNGLITPPLVPTAGWTEANPTINIASFNSNLVEAGPSKNGGLGLAFLSVVVPNPVGGTSPVITLSGIASGQTGQASPTGPSFDTGAGQTVTLPSPFIAAIPEPTLLGVLAAGSAMLLRRRK